MSLFQIPKWETDTTREALDHSLFEHGSTEGTKNNKSRKISLPSLHSSKNKKKARYSLPKKLTNVKIKQKNKEIGDYVKATLQSVVRVKHKRLLKSNRANNLPSGNVPEEMEKNIVTASTSETNNIRKRKRKKKKFKVLRNENDSENSFSLPEELKQTQKNNNSVCEIKAIALKGSSKKRKRIHSESAIPLLKSNVSNSEEELGCTRHSKLKTDIHTSVTDKQAQKPTYDIQKLKQIFAKTPPSSPVKNKKNIPSTLREKMMEKLQASRFRYLNEQLYTSEPKEAQTLFRSDPEAFQAYHEGYQHQVQHWPINPLDVIINSLKRKPIDLTIADFGCGDAQLAHSVPNKVHSFDIVALSDEVIACNMAHTPLSNSSVDVVVFCLSLMGKSLREFFIEANRVLKEGGIMKIAEVESRFDNIDEFIAKLQKFGFACTWKNFSYNLFCFMDFKKERNISKKMKKKKLPELILKPCLYKKR